MSEAPGYALRLAPGAIDLDHFEQHAAAGRAAMHRNEHAAALADFDAALAHWRGQPLGAVGGDDSLDAIVVRLDEEHAAVVEDRFEVLLRLGRHGVAVSGLQEAVDERPLRERRWGQLALALYRSHRQADALRAIGAARIHAGRRARSGARSRAAGPRDPDPGACPGARRGRCNGEPRTERAREQGPAVAQHVAPAGPPPVRLVGREHEWRLMERALDAGAGVVTLEGEAGIGKTAMLAALADEAAHRDWSVLWGQCVEPGLAPPLWPWIEVLRALVAAGSGAAFDIAPSLVELAQPSASAPPPANLVEVADELATELTSGTRPRLIVLDDLHWADAPTLDLLALLIQRIGVAPVVIAIAHRPTDLTGTPALAASLSTVARSPATTRITLDGLDVHAVADLLGDVGGRRAR